MSGIIIIAPFLAALTCGGLWLVLQFIRRLCSPGERLRRSSVMLLVLFVWFVWFPVATIGYLIGLSHALTDTGTNLTWQAANKVLLTFDLPASAKAVDVYSSLATGLTDAADFTIAEQDFLDWLAKNDWKAREFVSTESGIRWVSPGEQEVDQEFVCVSPLNCDHDMEVRNGYEYTEIDERNRDAVFDIVYDKQLQRAFVRRTTF